MCCGTVLTAAPSAVSVPSRCDKQLPLCALHAALANVAHAFKDYQPDSNPFTQTLKEALHTSGDKAHNCCQSILCRCSCPSLDTTAHRSMVGHQHVRTMSELRATSFVREKLLSMFRACSAALPTAHPQGSRSCSRWLCPGLCQRHSCVTS